MKFEDLEVWKRSLRLCADLYKHFQDIMGMLLLKTENAGAFMKNRFNFISICFSIIIVFTGNPLFAVETAP
ncbi:MAG: hypothetical protein J7L16_05315, partial [Deltaproteobacteria bacterium]|nr:hypothetical protein [Deltaproteobacteria bacterium]